MRPKSGRIPCIWLNYGLSGKQGCFFYVCPEVAGVAVAVFAGPDAYIGLVIPADGAFILYMPVMIVVVITKHVGIIRKLKCFYPIPVFIIFRFI